MTMRDTGPRLITYLLWKINRSTIESSPAERRTLPAQQRHSGRIPLAGIQLPRYAPLNCSSPLKLAGAYFGCGHPRPSVAWRRRAASAIRWCAERPPRRFECREGCLLEGNRGLHGTYSIRATDDRLGMHASQPTDRTLRRPSQESAGKARAESGECSRPKAAPAPFPPIGGKGAGVSVGNRRPAMASSLAATRER